MAQLGLGSSPTTSITPNTLGVAASLNPYDANQTKSPTVIGNTADAKQLDEKPGWFGVKTKDQYGPWANTTTNPTAFAGDANKGTLTLLNAQGIPVAPGGETGNAGSGKMADNFNPDGTPKGGVKIVGPATDPGSTPTFIDPATGAQVSNANVSGGMFGLGSQNFSTYSTDPGAATNQALPGEMQQLDREKQAVSQQQAATSAGTSADNRFLGLQADTIGGMQGTASLLQQEANGQGPAADAVRQQTADATNRGVAAQMALASASRGGNAGETARQAAMGMANVTGEAGAQAAKNTLESEQLGISNTLAAQNDISNAATSGQGQAIQEAQQGQQNQQFNATQMQQNQQFVANLVAQYTAQGMNAEQAQAAAKQQLAEENTRILAQQQAAKVGVAEAGAQAQTQAAASAASALGTAAAAMSDKTLKKKIESGDAAAQDFLDSLVAKGFHYKNTRFGDGKQLGIMAQDLEDTPVGEQMVEDTPEGKQVNIAKGYTAIMAAQALLNKRLKALEGKHA